MKLLQPDNLVDALQMLAEADRPLVPIAGGTDLCVNWPRVDKQDLRLLDLSRLQEARSMRLSEAALELGALTSFWDVIQSVAVGEAFPLLTQAARLVGAIQIQTRGTWVGNIANGSPAADGVLAMLAYDASVTLRSMAGSRDVPLDTYFTGYKQSVRRPDELITSIRIPRRHYETQWLAKVGARKAQAISKVGVALVRGGAGWRVAANSVAPFVCRCRTLEAALDGGRTFGSPAEVQDVLTADIAPITDGRSTAAYRARVLSRLIYFHLAELAAAVAT